MAGTLAPPEPPRQTDVSPAVGRPPRQRIRTCSTLRLSATDASSYRCSPGSPCSRPCSCRWSRSWSPAGATTPTTIVRAAPAPVAAIPPAAAATKTISLSAAGSVKTGPDGKLHDASPRQTSPSRWVSPSACGLTTRTTPTTASRDGNRREHRRPARHPHLHVDAKKAGRFEWMCVLPCDDWAMMHPGYMAGYITAT